MRDCCEELCIWGLRELVKVELYIGDKEISFDKSIALVTVLGPGIGSNAAAEVPAEAAG